MLTLPLLLAHFKLSHVGGCQTGAPQCGVSLIRTDRHQRESAACGYGAAAAASSSYSYFLRLFFFPETSKRNRGSALLSVCDVSPASPVHRLISLPPSSLAVSAGQPERRHGHSVHTERAGEQLLRGLRRAQYVSSLHETSDFFHRLLKQIIKSFH